MQRLAILGLILTVLVTGHAIALCAQDCADASIASNHARGAVGGDSEGSCHGDAAMPGPSRDSSPTNAPRVPHSKDCAGHAQSIFVAARVAKIRALAPHQTFVTIVPEYNLFSQQFVYRAAASTASSIPILDSSPQALALRI
ncbi:MAG TPA: hypothetical protein VFO34_12125 [Candidatus Acidoferrales bacterium]|nr:hypothetical protein [Candidatus Acidoferrales bacterium]